MWVDVALPVLVVWLVLSAGTAYGVGHAVRIADQRTDRDR